MEARHRFPLIGLPVGAGILLGAILAPTEPVLATGVQSRHPGTTTNCGSRSPAKPA